MIKVARANLIGYSNWEKHCAVITNEYAIMDTDAWRFVKLSKPMPIPDDFDVEAERRRLRQGGCCSSGNS